MVRHLRKNITATFLICSLGGGAYPVFAQADVAQESVQKSTEKSWQDTIKLQVELARVKLTLLKAQNELWLTKNKEKTQALLDESLEYLDDAWKTADSASRAQVKELRQRIDQTKVLLAKENKNIELEIKSLVSHSESILSSVQTQTQAKSEDFKNEMLTYHALITAKSSELKAIIALEIDKSPEKAHQEMVKAEESYQQASETASKVLASKITSLKQQAASVKRSIIDNSNSAKSQLESLISATEIEANNYKKAIEDSSESELFKRRYAQLEAQSAILKAKLSLYSNDANSIVLSYLEESKNWYDIIRSQSLTKWHKEEKKMLANIEEAKLFVNRKDTQARNKIATLLEEAAAIVKKEDATK